jgi:hypothetical protein
MRNTRGLRTDASLRRAAEGELGKAVPAYTYGEAGRPGAFP